MEEVLSVEKTPLKSTEVLLTRLDGWLNHWFQMDFVKDVWSNWPMVSVLPDLFLCMLILTGLLLLDMKIMIWNKLLVRISI
jgi:hypothetical protein